MGYNYAINGMYKYAVILQHFLLSSFSNSLMPGKVQDKISARSLSHIQYLTLRQSN